jgi:hypothetical protein
MMNLGNSSGTMDRFDLIVVGSGAGTHVASNCLEGRLEGGARG